MDEIKISQPKCTFIWSRSCTDFDSINGTCNYGEVCKNLQRKINIFELSDYRKGGCEFWDNSPDWFFKTWKSTKHKPCDECCYYADGRCPGYQRMVIKQQTNTPSYPEPIQLTNAEWADKLGISKRQVSKRRKLGTLHF